MSLGATQREFARHMVYLKTHILASGYEFTEGDSYRDPRSHGKMGDKGVYGRPYSAHKQKLACDINLFKDGIYLRSTKAHEIFGEYWCGIHPDNVWGGDFNDGNHYSRRFGGIA